MINHVTYHVSPETLMSPSLKEFMEELGLREQDPSRDGLEAGWNVRWFKAGWPLPGTLIHLVATGGGDQDRLALGHFCIAGIGKGRYEGLRRSRWVARDSGSGRIWLEFGGPPRTRQSDLRVEVRP